MKKSLGKIAATAIAMAAIAEKTNRSMFTETEQSEPRRLFSKPQMTNKQKKARAASKRAGKARKINR